MAPRGRGRGRRKVGSTREDAARDRMRDLGFNDRVINESIKQVLEVYGEDHWYLIESDGYEVLEVIGFQKQEELDKQLAEERKEIAQEEQQVENNQEHESVQHVEDVRDHSDQFLITHEAVMDPSAATLHSTEAFADYAPHSVAIDGLNCGWLSDDDTDSEETRNGDDVEMIQPTREPLCENSDGDDDETDPEENSNGDDVEMIQPTPGPLSEEDTDPEENMNGDVEDTPLEENSDGDDDEMIQLTPEPLCEELEELLREVRGEKKRKKESRWDK